jgi:hypothetical protein
MIASIRCANRTSFRLVSIACVGLLLSACTKRVVVPPGEVGSPEDSGRRFLVRLVNGQVYDVDGITVRGNTLVLNTVVEFDRHVPIEVEPNQVASIERVQTDWTKVTIVLSLIVVSVALGVWVLTETDLSSD